MLDASEHLLHLLPPERCVEESEWRPAAEGWIRSDEPPLGRCTRPEDLGGSGKNVVRTRHLVGYRDWHDRGMLQSVERSLGDAERLGDGPNGQIERRDQAGERCLSPRTAAFAHAGDAAV